MGTPYTDEMIANARADLEAQVNPDVDPTGAAEALPARRRSASSTANAASVTEMDALVAYLQMLGTLVRFARPAARAAAAVEERIMGFETVGEILHLDLDGLGGAAVRRNRLWAWRPANRKRFERDARIPLDDEN